MKTELLYKLFRESSGVSTDSRSVSKDQIFFALWGENFNGNKFAAEALEKGASWAIIDDPVFETEKTILVDDCLFELQALASYYRKQMKTSVLAITGTNGKTTTKELLSAILSKKFKVHATTGNLNNQIGVPLTILSAPEGTEMMIIEMGASHVGDIRTLCLIAKPDYGIITNVGTAHTESFGTFEGVLKAKTELYDHLRKVNGIALYNDKDHFLSEKIYKLVNRAVPFSYPTGTDLIITSEPSGINLNLKASYNHKTYHIKTNLFGTYNIENVKAAVATGLFFEIETENIVKAVEDYIPGNNRSQVRESKNNILVCDSYNANPISMRLAIESFSALASDKKLCILGDMLELGEKSSEEHLKIIKALKDNNLENILLAGPLFSSVATGSGFKTFPDTGKLKEFLKKEPLKGYHILVKGSRGMALEKIYDLL